MEDEQHDSLKHGEKIKGAKGGAVQAVAILLSRRVVSRDSVFPVWHHDYRLPRCARWSTSPRYGAPSPFTGFLINAFIVMWLLYLV
jgi:hypothetical protein